MKYYKIIALTCSGRGNKIHRAGDIVPEDQLEPKAIQGLVDGGFIEPASKADMEGWKKEGNKTQEEQIAANKEQAEAAEKDANKELDAAKAEFMEVSGVAEEDLNKTWGVPAFKKNTKQLLTNKYNELAGDEAEDVTALNNDQLKEKIAELPSATEVFEALETQYKEQAGEKAEDVSELSITELRAKIAELSGE